MKEKIYKIYTQAFSDDMEWNRWFFDNVYRDDEAMLLIKGGNAVSTLLLQEYAFAYMSREVPMVYVSGVATSPESRGKGYMSELLGEALRKAAGRSALASLVPSGAHLVQFYRNFGFAPVVLLDCERYTSVHAFAMSQDYTPCEPTYEGFSALEKTRSATVLHTRSQFENILWDIKHEKGTVCAVQADDGHIAAMSFAVADREQVTVRELLAENSEAAEAVLAETKAMMPELPMEVWAPPAGRASSLRMRGMMRILDVGAVLDALAHKHPETDQVIRVHDAQIPSNNSVFIVRDGKCERTDSTIRRLTLDVSIEVLTTILFSSEKTGSIFGIPSGRPMLPLMLD